MKRNEYRLLRNEGEQKDIFTVKQH